MRSSDPSKPGALPMRRSGLAANLVGALGAAVISVTLYGVRVWARLTRTPYYKD